MGGEEETHNDSEVTDVEFDIPKKARKANDATEVFTIYRRLENENKDPIFPQHGIMAHPPLMATVKPMKDDVNSEITFHYKNGTNQRKLQDLQGNELPEDSPLRKDQKEIVSKQFIEWLKAEGWMSAGAGGMGGMGDPMGGGMGMDPMGGGMPPMGGPMDTGMAGAGGNPMPM
jgi:hypothetical protein